MLINRNINCNNHVEFIDYTGEYPNLCRGILTLKIDGNEVKFGHDYNNYNITTGKFNDTNYGSFWSSGGGLDRNYCAYSGQWEIDVNDIPEQYKKYAAEIDDVFNANVRYGCCGGCS